LYAYRCTECGHKFEKIQNFSAEPETECPKCHGVLERPLTAPGLNFKGAGWYVNDYAPKSSSSGGDSDSKSESKAESKSDSKSDSKPDSKSDSKSDSGSAAKESKPASSSSDSKSSAPAASSATSGS
jgi:putative FmdB family regulatory protein